MTNKYPTINYIGNKAKITDWILDLLPVKEGTIVDLFSGGCSVSYALKKAGYRVISNDMLYSNYVISKALIENSEVTLKKNDYENIVINESDIEKKYNEIKFLSENIYFDYEVKELARLLLLSENLNGYKRYLFLSLLRRSMIRKIPYSRMNVKWDEIKKLRDEEYSYKKYGRYRSYHNKSFLYHIEKYLDEFNASIFNNYKNNLVYQMDVIDFVRHLEEKVELVYLDPPYPSTMNNYVGFYGYFDDINNRKINQYLDLTKKQNFLENLEKIITLLIGKTQFIAISLNNKSKPSSVDICKMLDKYCCEIDIYKKEHVYKITGKENKNKNFEILIVARLNN